MGDPRKTRKHFKRPLKIWDRASIEREKAIKTGYGLKNKREIWSAESLLRKKRKSARSLLAMPLEERQKRERMLLNSLIGLGIMDEKATLDDVLTLNVESFLERRLQTIVWRKGLANTAKQARQFITHGHIAIAGKRVTAPSYLVKPSEEAKIGYYAGKKMEIRPAEKEAKGRKKTEKKSLAEEFEEAKPAEEENKGEKKEAAGKKEEALDEAEKAEEAKAGGKGKSKDAQEAKGEENDDEKAVSE